MNRWTTRICGGALWLAGTIGCGIAVNFAITGCSPAPPPPPPPPAALLNKEDNEITHREQIATYFNTADVLNVPASSNEFLVRDNNGVIWYVSFSAGRVGSTRMFGWHPEFPKPEPPPTVTLTNSITITNWVTFTNYIVEDPSTNRSK